MTEEVSLEHLCVFAENICECLEYLNDEVDLNEVEEMIICFRSLHRSVSLCESFDVIRDICGLCRTKFGKLLDKLEILSRHHLAHDTVFEEELRREWDEHCPGLGFPNISFDNADLSNSDLTIINTCISSIEEDVHVDVDGDRVTFLCELRKKIACLKCVQNWHEFLNISDELNNPPSRLPKFERKSYDLDERNDIVGQDLGNSVREGRADNERRLKEREDNIGKRRGEVRKIVNDVDKKVKQITNHDVNEKRINEIENICKSLNVKVQQFDKLDQDLRNTKLSVRKDRTDNERRLKKMEDNIGKLHEAMDDFDKRVNQIENHPIDNKQTDEIGNRCESLDLRVRSIEDHIGLNQKSNEESPFWMLLMGIVLVVFLVFTHVNMSGNQR